MSSGLLQASSIMEAEGWEGFPAPEGGPCPLSALLHPWASVVVPGYPHHPGAEAQQHALLRALWLEPLLHHGSSCLPLQFGDVARVCCC